MYIFKSKTNISTLIKINGSFFLALALLLTSYYYEGELWSFSDMKVMVLSLIIPASFLIFPLIILEKLGTLVLTDRSLILNDTPSLKIEKFIEISYEAIDNIKFQSEMIIFELKSGELFEFFPKYHSFEDEKGRPLDIMELKKILNSRIFSSDQVANFVKPISRASLDKIIGKNVWYKSFYYRALVIIVLAFVLYRALTDFEM